MALAITNTFPEAPIFGNCNFSTAVGNLCHPFSGIAFPCVATPFPMGPDNKLGNWRNFTKFFKKNYLIHGVAIVNVCTIKDFPREVDKNQL